MKIDFANLQLQYQKYKSDIDDNIQSVLNKSNYIMGEEVKQLESNLSSFTGAKHTITCSNGTDALLLSMMALNIQPGDEVITSPFTFISTAETIASIKAKPVFVDIEADTFNTDANLIEAAGATRLITMDLHADQIQGFFEIPVDHLYASTIFIPYIESLNLNELTIASPDMGGSKRAYAYSRFLKSNVVICYKQRKKANVVSHMELIGKVEGKNVVIVDDMVDTAGTLTKAADLMMERGAKSVRAICTHALLSGNAYENIEKSKLKELIVTDSIPQQKKSDKVKVITCSKLFADVMQNVNSNKSINSFFIK